MKVLLIDDDLDVLILASFALEKHGAFEVVTCSGGIGAVDLALRERPDLVLLDLQMPEIDGDELYGHLRLRPELARTPIVFLTGQEAEDQHRRLLRLGALGIIVKPFDPETLAAQVQAFLSVWPAGATIDRRKPS